MIWRLNLRAHFFGDSWDLKEIRDIGRLEILLIRVVKGSF